MRCGVSLAVLLVSVATPALAQTAGAPAGAVTGEPVPSPQLPATGVQAPGQRVYEAVYFARFSPATAAQIVAQVPGFTIEEVDEAIRGFAGAAGNVVVNGQRPSSKADTTATVLQRIPAARVLRVEVGPGDRYGADYAGKPQVLNLVLTAAGGLAGTVEAGLRRDFTGQLLPEGNASALVRRGRSTFNASLAVRNERTSEEGEDRLRALPGGAELEYRRKLNHIHDPNVAIAGSWGFDDGTNRTAHLNARGAINRFSLTQNNHVVPTGGTIRNDLLTQRYRNDSFEVGGDVTRPLAGGGLKLIALATRRYRTNRDVSLNRVAGGTTGGVSQTLDDTRAETLTRLVWSRGAPTGWTVEVGAEGVLNRLDSQVDLFRLGAGGAAMRIDLPIDTAVVREVRGEAFVNAGRALSSRLRADLGLTAETSRLTVTGDATAERVLTFVKPKVTLDWQPGGGWRTQLTVRRTVAQLQFEDFISGAELANDRVNGGNAELLPQRAWEVAASAEHPLLHDGLVKVGVEYQRIALVQDRVPTPDGFDAPGNLGDGRVLLASANLEAPLGRFGIDGGRLTLRLAYADSNVVDPYTLRTRSFSGYNLLEGKLAFRQDRRGFAWGWSVQGRTAATLYRLDELDRNTSDFPFVSAFAEWRPKPTTTVSLMVDNLLDLSGRRQRTFFSPDRRNRVPGLVEARVRNQRIVPLLSVRHSFG